MKRIVIRGAIAIVGFTLGIACAGIWISKRPSSVTTPPSSKDCATLYDANLIAGRIRENDDPELFRAFQELPLYAMPDCVDEAYSLTWIPSFHAPVIVRVWRAGDHAFMVAKALDSKGWSRFGNVRESNARRLTKFEWRDLTDLLNRSSYWKLPETIAEIVPEDGAVWLVDGLRSKEYHWARRRAPKEQYTEISKNLKWITDNETQQS
jgi:hypothetical protein